MKTVNLENGIYIASKTKHAERWKILRANKFPIISTWIDEAEQGQSQDLNDLWHRCINEASNCACMIIYAEEQEILEGAFIELGCALSNNKPIFAVGLPENLTILKHNRIKVCYDLATALAFALKECIMGEERK